MSGAFLRKSLSEEYLHEDLSWIKSNKGKKPVAALFEEIIAEDRTPNHLESK